MGTKLQVGEITVDVVLKDIKNVHLCVLPPDGTVRVSAPSRASLETLRIFVISKLDWIRRQQQKLLDQERVGPREYVDRESHHVWGRRYLLEVREADEPPAVVLKHSRLVLQVRPGTVEARRQEILDEWYRAQLRDAVPALLAKWEPLIGVKVQRIFVQKMKTRWGSCTAETGTIRLNTELAKKPRQSLEYIVVHEMIHLMVRRHDVRFVALMDQYLPKWRHLREELNAAPLAHATWEY